MRRKVQCRWWPNEYYEMSQFRFREVSVSGEVRDWLRCIYMFGTHYYCSILLIEYSD